MHCLYLSLQKITRLLVLKELVVQYGLDLWIFVFPISLSNILRLAKELGRNFCTLTSGSQSYAVKRDKFEREHNREPGAIEWFIETDETKEKTFHEPVTTKLVESTMTMIKEKTGSSEVKFSEETSKVEKSIYRKLMGDETHGKLIGFDSGVTVKDLRAKHQKSESKLLVKVLNKMLAMQNQIDDLTTKVAAQSANSEPESSTGSPQNLVNDMPRDQRSHESRRSRDALSVAHALVKDTQRGSTLSKHINIEPGKQQKPPKNIQPSNHPIKMGHVTPRGGTPAREQPVHRDGGPTLGGGTPTSASTSIPGGPSTQKRTITGMNNKFTEQGNSKRPKSNVVYPLTYDEDNRKGAEKES